MVYLYIILDGDIMNKIKEFVSQMLASKDSWLGVDKLLHFCIGFIIAAVSCIAFPNFWPLGIGLASIAGLGKEIYDFKTPGHVASKQDLITTVLGSVFGVLLFKLMILAALS
jgi:uncharacterized protein YfiM (DUF2279 family)